MNIKVNTYKDITPALRKEMVWHELGRVQQIIGHLYKQDNWKFDDPYMEKVYYDLNAMCVKLSEDGDMAWQLKEKEKEPCDTK